jgi:hypothetical protein
VELRLGLNLIRITAEAERDWQDRMLARSVASPHGTVQHP